MTDFPIQHRPVLPAKKDYRIALCGAGGVVNDAHLPAYSKAGFHVVGIFDPRRESAKQTAARFGIPRVYGKLEELGGDSQVDIVDIAVPASENLGLVEKLAPAGKALLLQKPMAEDFETALKTVAAVDRAKVRAAVNQQMRWEPGIRATKSLLDAGWLGELYNIAVLNFVDTPWHLWGWLMKKPQIEVLYHSIHYIDSIRFLTGRMPGLVFCDGSRKPGHESAGETRICLQMIFKDNLRATIVSNHHASHGLEGQQSEFRIEGTEGAASRKMGLNMNYPKGVPDAYRFASSRLGAKRWMNVEFAETWIPDAFVGPMASLMRAMSGEIERPETDVHDNLDTLRLIFTAYESMATRMAVSPGDISSGVDQGVHN